MKIGIIGYGKMGKTIEKIALTRGHSIVFKVNDYNKGVTKDVDIAIDFVSYLSSQNITNVSSEELLKRKMEVFYTLPILA